MHSFAPFFNLKISAKNRQHFFAIEYWISDLLNFLYFLRQNLHFSANFWWNFVRISRQIPEKNDVCRLFNQMCENKLENCREFWNLRNILLNIHYFLFVSLGAPGGRSALGFLGGPVLAPGQRDNAAAGQSLYYHFARKKTAGFWPNCFCVDLHLQVWLMPTSSWHEPA